MEISQLIPMRFVILLAHLVLVICFLWDREKNVRACLPWEVYDPSEHYYSKSEYRWKDAELITGLSLALAFIVLELVGFMGGISMFCPMQSLFSLIAHSCACITLAYFITDVWDCTVYWWIFAFCSVLPALTESIVIIKMTVFTRTI